MAQGKEYFAFISYKREDEKWAKWLQHKLEHYHLPVNVRKDNPSLPQSIRPVFKDTSELAAGVLADEIHEALENSKYLIVICSPRAAQSKWVGKEVQTFIDMGRSDKIIPFIIGGIPFSDNPEEECFPSALLNLPKEQELLGVNINEMGREAAVVKVVARMFGLKFDTLWQRYEREQKRKRWMWIGGSILLALFGLSIGGYFVRQNGIIERQNERLQQDSVTMAEHITRIQNDSIKLSIQNDSISLQNALILNQRDSLKTTTQELQLSNKLLAEERDNVLRANYGMQVNLSRNLAEKASSLVDDGDTYLARLISLQALPPIRPFTFEAERALRKSINCDNAILRGHNNTVQIASFSPDGKYIISVSWDNTIRIWDAQTGNQMKCLEGSSSFTDVKFNPQNNNLFASASLDGFIKVWNRNTLKCVNEIKVSAKSVNNITFSPNGKLIASASDDKYIRIYDAETGKCRKKMLNEEEVRYLSFNSNGDKIVSIDGEKLTLGNNCIRIWDIKTDKCIKTFNDSLSKNVNTAIFSPDGNAILIGTNMGDGKIYLIDISTGDVLQIFEGHSFGVFSVEYSHNGNSIVSAGGDGAIRIWDTNYGRCKKVLKGHTSYVLSAQFSPSGSTIVSSSMDKTVRLWDISNNHILVNELKGHNTITESVKYSNDGKYIISTSLKAKDSCPLIIWDSRNFTPIHFISDFPEHVSYAEFSPNGKQFITASGVLIKIWNTNNFHCTLTLKGHTDKVKYVTYSSDGRKIASASNDNTIRIWNAHEGDCILTLRGHTSTVKEVHFSPNNNRLVSASLDGTVRLWNAYDGRCEVILNHSNPVTSVVLNNQCDIAISASTDGNIYFWDLRKKKCIRTIEGHTSDVNSVVLSPDGSKLLSASTDATLKIWEVTTGLCLQVLFVDKSWSSFYATFSPTGDRIASATMQRICIWDFPPLQELINQSRERFKNRPLTTEERRKYYLD